MQRLFSAMFALAIVIPTLGVAVHTQSTRSSSISSVSTLMPVPMCDPDYKGVCPIGGPKVAEQGIVDAR